MRRRHTVLPLADMMEIGQQWNNKYSRVCLLASLSALFWFYLLYFNLVLFGGNKVADFSPLSESFSNISPWQNSLPVHPNPSPVSPSLNVHRPGNDSSRGKVLDNDAGPETPYELKIRDSESSKKDDPKPQEKKSYPFMRALQTLENKSDPCAGRYIYVHDLPPVFNEDILENCDCLNPWMNMCRFIRNGALGPPLGHGGGVFSATGWHATNQFALDVLFRNRMKQYECLTNDSSVAAAIFVPFYAGLDVARYLWGQHNVSTRDAGPLAAVDWLMKRPEWSIMGGKDHFLVGGRIAWDFRRMTERETDWGNKLLLLPAAKNMSMLVLEASPWNANNYAIPYPTYFHPAKDSDVFKWQKRMRFLQRKHLFCFAGAPRPESAKSIRSQIIDQCNKSRSCRLLECVEGGGKCNSPSNIMRMFQSSVFCLQPQGDSYTRRSTFDSILAGCIPVFFHPGSAYTQYTWHLPKDYSEYSVFFPEDDVRRNISIEQRLSQIPVEKVKAMRDVVINLIPRIIYADPRSKLETLKDAFDISIQAVIDKVTKLRKDIIAGRKDNRIEQLTWKYALLDEDQALGPHEWDPFFSKSRKGHNKVNSS